MDLVTILIGIGVIVALLALANDSDLPNTIAGYAKNAGFSGVDLGIAVAIAYAESSGNDQATNLVPPDNSYGLWQINLNAHPEYDATSMLDPQQNANAAFAIYSAAGNSFSPWTTFGNGQYLNNAQQAQDATGIDISGTDDIGDQDEDDE